MNVLIILSKKIKEQNIPLKSQALEMKGFHVEKTMAI